ncbi:hypothetical protein L1987_71830 [Smallanthus sonchifolius]|uniref:Uncharacterized protein n=1 Tax=Smallanthus sonchifolius TaxID=185202 RepID=A0ACB9ATJ4_9ASTR|nr:hypothetical protein L1987_71830 [Smallanthus sonchifolius]
MPTTTDQKQLINLFPLHPENLVEQYKLDEEHNMACNIFSSCDDVDKAATTLTGILRSDDDDDDNDNDDGNTNNPSPSSVNYADEEVELVRTAMRRNKTEMNDNEKWVCYSEVVERKEIRGMSSSSSSTTSCYHQHNNHHRSKLALKLDYEKIMKSWVNKGPLYIHGSSGMDAPQPQTVPDLHDDDFFFPSFVNGTKHDEQDNVGNGGSWTVPEMTHTENNGVNKGDDALQAGESSAMIHNREASVQRYKEKRRNRLFAKTIRYEVRKLNAEKRPRIKGRFVKRN